MQKEFVVFDAFFPTQNNKCFFVIADYCLLNVKRRKKHRYTASDLSMLIPIDATDLGHYRKNVAWDRF